MRDTPRRHGDNQEESIYEYVFYVVLLSPPGRRQRETIGDNLRIFRAPEHICAQFTANSAGKLRSRDGLLMPRVAHFLIVQTTRKPLPSKPLFCTFLARDAERQSPKLTPQLPPRRVTWPDTGPVGSVSLPLEYPPYLSRHHSHTFPCMSYKPHGFGFFNPTGCVASPELTFHHA